MKISQHMHQRIRLKNGLLTFVILAILIALAWLSRQHSMQIDVSAHANNTLSTASQKILTTLPDPIQVIVYIKEKNLQKQVAQLLNKYERFKSNISIHYIDPSTVPEKSRELDIGPQGAIVVSYKDRSEKLNYLDESTFSNALLQLANTKERWITFLTGHGERSISKKANFGLSLFSKQLQRHKIKARTINLAKVSTIPNNSSLLVLTAPTVPLLAGELNIISNYIQQGGSLLLLTDPENQHLKVIEQQLGVNKLVGKVVDMSSGLYGIDDPSFVLISEYQGHPITANFNNMTVFPITAALAINEESAFESAVLFKSIRRSWTESGAITGEIRFDPDTKEQEGPLAIAYALTRTFLNKKQQRVVVVGDGDFLSNAYLGNVGNSELGFRMINWLTHDDQFIEIPYKITQEKTLHLSKISLAIIGLAFLFGLPLLLMITGIIIWRKRKRR